MISHGQGASGSRLRDPVKHDRPASLDVPASLEDKLAQAVERIKTHDHVCLIYTSREEQFATIAPYLKAGLERHERFLYAVDENTASAVMAGMRTAGVDVDDAVADEALILATEREPYVRGGVFDPDVMISFLQNAAKDATDAGFSAVRVTGEMTWALAGEPGAERVLEYEAKLNTFLPDADASAICQYNADRFSPATIEHVLQTHPQVIYGGLVCPNAYYVPPAELLEQEPSETRVRRLLTNIVDRERAEEEIRALNATLEKRVTHRTQELALANRDLERFISMVSHDLRAPLRGAAFYLQALREDYADRLPVGAHEYVLGAERENARASELVNALLSLARADQGPLERTTVDLSSIASEILEQFQREHPLRRVDARVEPGGVATGDPDLLRTALQNLIANAWKYTERQADSRIRFSWADTPDGRAFRIEDNGAGFPPHLAPTLFQPFQRLHGAEFSGTGVGLATVRRIIERHGGRVRAEGKTGEGAAFTIVLPRE